jgi:hypothetical protein
LPRALKCNENGAFQLLPLPRNRSASMIETWG